MSVESELKRVRGQRLPFRHSEKTKKKISESKKGKFHTEESKQKISESLMGDKNPRFGKHHSDESNEKNRQAHRGKHHTEKTLKLLSKINKGKGNGMFGKHHSQDTRRKISEAERGKIISEETKTKVLEARQKYLLTKGLWWKPSKPQIELFNLVKQLHSDAKMECPILKYIADIVIPSLKIVIEYEGSFWHERREERDLRRQKEIEESGWRVIRFRDKIPSILELKTYI